MNLLKLSLPALCLAILTLTSCDRENFCQPGAGGIVTRTLSLSSFSSVDFQEAGEVIISQGAAQEVVAVGHANIVDHLREVVSHGEWKIDLGNRCYDDYDLTIYITVPELDAITLSGSGHITVNDFIDQGDDLDMTLPGSGSITLGNFVGPQDLSVNISGSGTITTYGSIPTLHSQNIRISGSGKYQGFNNPSDDCTIQIPGSGTCEVTASQLLDVRISGSGIVYFKGHPSISSNITGSGSVVDAN